MKEKAQKVLLALDNGEISEDEARSLLTRLKAGSSGTAEYVEQAPEELGVVDRAIAESFGANPQAKLGFYQKKYPDSDVQLEKGRITFKGEGNKRYFADPDAPGFDGFGELGRDALEAVVPVGAGFLEAGAAGVGGLIGATGGTAVAPGVGTVLGGLAGASAAGAASGDLIERGRQGIGSMLGMENNVDADEISSARTFGAVSPLFLGFDKPLRAMKGPLKSMAKTAAKKGFGKGAVGMGKDVAVQKVFPSLASAASGKSKASIRTLLNNFDELSQAAKDTPFYEMVGNLGDGVQKGFQKNYNKISKKFGKQADKLAKETGNLDISGNLRPLKLIVDKYETQFKDDALDVLAKEYGSREQAAVFLRTYMDDGVGSALVKKGKNYKKELKRFNEVMKNRDSFKSYKHVNKQIKGRLPVVDKVAPSKAMELKSTINDLSGVRKGKDSVGMGSLDRDIMNAAKQSAKNIDKKLTRIKGGGEAFEKVKKQYTQVAKEKNQVTKYFGDTQKDTVATTTEGTLNKLLSGNKEVTKEEIKNAAAAGGKDIVKEGTKIKTIKDFLDPSLSPLSDTIGTGSRSIPLSVAGSTAGYFAGDSIGGGGAAPRAAGTVAGGLIGAIAGGPKAIRMYVRALNAAGKVRRASPISGPQSFNVWENMNKGNE